MAYWRQPIEGKVQCTMCTNQANHYDDDSLPYCSDSNHNSVTRTQGVVTMDHRSFFQQLSEEPEEPEEYCEGTSGHIVYRDTRHIVCDTCGSDMGTEWSLKAEGYGVGRIPLHRVSN